MRSLGLSSIDRFLRLFFGVLLYAILGWIVALAVQEGFGLDARDREASAFVFVVVVLSAGLWAQWFRSGPVVQAAQGTMSVDLAPGGLTMSTATYDVRCSWSEVDKIEVVQSYVVITYLRGRGVAIPADSFVDAAATARFVEAARELRDASRTRAIRERLA